MKTELYKYAILLLIVTNLFTIGYNKAKPDQVETVYKIIETVKTEYIYIDKPQAVTVSSMNKLELSKSLQTFEVTAYTAGPESTGKTPDHPAYGITASGATVKEHHTIACPKSMPFGTRIYIPYFDNTYTCEDRGGAITEGKLDIYMPELSEALQFGRRNLEIIIEH